jgi:hypothetical protein
MLARIGIESGPVVVESDRRGVWRRPQRRRACSGRRRARFGASHHERPAPGRRALRRRRARRTGTQRRV